MRPYQASFVFLFCFFLVATITGCDKNKVDQNLSLSFKGMIGDEVYTTGEWYPNAANQYFKIEKFRFYVSQIDALNEAGESVTIAEVDLYDLQNPTPIRANLPSGNYQSLTFHIGLDEALNNSDPSLFGADEPLGNSEHYWTWATKYIFAMIRGKVAEEANPDVANTGNFVYDLGTQELLQTVTIDRTFSLSEEEVQQVEIIIQIDQIFNDTNGPLDMISENVTHSFDKIELAKELMKNLAAAMK